MRLKQTFFKFESSASFHICMFIRPLANLVLVHQTPGKFSTSDNPLPILFPWDGAMVITSFSVLSLMSNYLPYLLLLYLLLFFH